MTRLTPWALVAALALGGLVGCSSDEPEPERPPQETQQPIEPEAAKPGRLEAPPFGSPRAKLAPDEVLREEEQGAD